MVVNSDFLLVGKSNMLIRLCLFGLAVLGLSCDSLLGAGFPRGPLRVHGKNARYFSHASGKAIILSGSHTWANFQERGVEGHTPEFDYEAYLDFMEAHEHNFMRLWRWEHAQWMQFVPQDTLIRYKPMAYMRTGPGEALDGKPRFDLTQFNQAYFDRLRERVVSARQRGIYVGVMLFQGFSIEQKGTQGVDPKKGNPWDGHPFNRRNNVNGIDGDLNGNGEGEETHMLWNPPVLKFQDAYVRKVVDTLNNLDNVLYEVSNESHGDSTQWQYHMIELVQAYEKGKPWQHPVGMSFQWGRNKGTNRNLFESPADWVCPNGDEFLNNPPANNGGKIVIVDNDHIKPLESDPIWVWRNFFRGNHFILMDCYKDFRIESPEHVDRKHDPARRAMGHAIKLAAQVNLMAMQPRNELASTQYCLANVGQEYLVYQPEEDADGVSVNLKAGQYAVRWIDPLDLTVVKQEAVDAKDGFQEFTRPSKRSAILHLNRR
ncbi:MAG: hypothetical protein HQ515_22700 [Phycisphaeraceae bacterium]|nr:hypothetical protein [Phycisphaeraceae bacterium]